MRDRTDADDIVQGAYNRALLELILPPMRRAAKDAGYAITVHGSLNRDIDLVAVPWGEFCKGNADALVMSLCGAVRGVTGRCNFMSARKQGDGASIVDWTAKPHGRKAATLLVWCGENSANLDLSVMPVIAVEKGEQE
ncbi:hypothetical protein F1640_14855 [Novosphingobium sp. NBM11]|uniref:hypothetical protein n=1 Tax=Novosphingobium sp. NBM11 TaxID=2596914 RepID=UPI001892074E|nr:hypothetical protein [Novosphingobium sp. NBM11]MBF5091266.1 hypothetical protein [Novosphingobium sp. NBM11]